MTGDSRPGDLAELAEDLGEDGATLSSAGSVDELRRMLLSAGPRRSSCVDAELLLRAHHGTAPGALDTARLLLTDRRWERLSSKLVHGLVRTGLLTDDDLDALALDELLAGEWLAYRVENMFTGGICAELPGLDRLDDGPDDEPPAGNGQLVALRRIPPPLRR